MSQTDWKKGDFALRKGKLCEVTHIDFSIHPPAVTVKMLDGGNEVGTEFSRLSKVAEPKWSCSVCTFDNDLKSEVCSVCMQGKRTNKVYLEALSKIENTLNNQKNLQINGIQPTHWKCNLCTFDNPMFNQECQMCLTVRSKDSKLIYPKNSNIENNNNNNENNNNENSNNNNNNNNNNKHENRNELSNNENKNLQNDEKMNENAEMKGENKNINKKGEEMTDDDDNTNSNISNKSNDSENGSNDSEWTLINKTDLNESQNEKNENENENENTNDDGDPYLDVE